jgi:hypothetical protein
MYSVDIYSNGVSKGRARGEIETSIPAPLEPKGAAPALGSGASRPKPSGRKIREILSALRGLREAVAANRGGSGGYR